MGNKKTAFPKDLSFKEIYDNNLFLMAKFYDSLNQIRLGEDVSSSLAGKNTLILGEPGSGKSFFSYCIIRNYMENKSDFVLPVELRKLFDSRIQPTYTSIIDFLFGRIETHARLLFIVDSIDEFCGTEECDEYCKSVLLELSKYGKVCVLCRRYEYDLYISSIILSDIFDEIFNVKEWDLKGFKNYLVVISEKEQIDFNIYFNIVAASDQLIELVKRPLHARMLVYVVKTSFGNIQHVRSLSDLYESYFSSLAVTVRGVQQREILISWRMMSWRLFNSAFVANRKIFLNELGSYDGKLVRVLAPIVNWSPNMGRESFTFLHYSFYEFLIAYHFTTELCNGLIQTDFNSCKNLFKKDFPLEIRHFSRMLLEAYRDNSAIGENLLQLYTFSSECLDITERRIANNLLLYFIGRISKVKPHKMETILVNESDPFLRTSIYWAMSNQGNTNSFFDYLGVLNDKEYAALNRGYLLYYYGDFDRNVEPPYLDSHIENSWLKTRISVIKMFKQEDYQVISTIRKLLDIYTFIDFTIFHETMLPKDELDCIEALIKSINTRECDIKKCIDVVTNAFLYLCTKQDEWGDNDDR